MTTADLMIMTTSQDAPAMVHMILDRGDNRISVFKQIYDVCNQEWGTSARQHFPYHMLPEFIQRLQALGFTEMLPEGEFTVIRIFARGVSEDWL